MSDIVERLREQIESVPVFPSAPWKVMTEAATEIERLHKEIDAMGAAISAALPYSYYMDPPDGGNVELPEQLRRMGEDAARYRWLRQYNVDSYMASGSLEKLDAAIDATRKGSHA